MIKINVVMASYNHEKFVGEAIQSVLSQTGCDFDFYIVDDGSSDNTVKEILKFKDPRIHFTSLNENQGACVAINKAISAGQAEYVAILNSDDKFLPNKLKIQQDFLNSNSQIAAVFSSPQFIDHKGGMISDRKNPLSKIFQTQNRTCNEWLNHFFFKHNCLCHPSLMIRRNCYDTLGYYDPRMAQIPDFDFWVRLSLKHQIHILQEELIQFRILPNNANASAPRKDVFNRARWEFLYILQHYLSIQTIDKYLKIFPNERGNIKVFDDELVPFYLAQLALKTDNDYGSSYRFFGLQTLYKLMNDERIAKKIAETQNFHYSDLIKESSQHHILVELPLLQRRLTKLLQYFKNLIPSTTRKRSP